MSDTKKRVHDVHLVPMIQRATAIASRHREAEKRAAQGHLWTKWREAAAAEEMEKIVSALRELQVLRSACYVLVDQANRAVFRDKLGHDLRMNVGYQRVKAIAEHGCGAPEGQDMSFHDISYFASIAAAIASGGVVQPKQPTETRNPGESIIRADITVKRRRELIDLYQGRIKAAVGRELARLQEEIQTQVTGVTFYEAHRLENGQAVYNCEIGVKP